VESLLKSVKASADWGLAQVKGTDYRSGTAIFVGAYIVYCLVLIYVCKYWYAPVRKQRRVRKAPQEPVGGKRSSQRIRLQKHELVFVERVTSEQFEQQKDSYTKQQL
jgi:hypothetical protein